jgi:hypothetical protein
VPAVSSIRSALIDDCSLAAKLKTIGPIWLGLTDRVHSIRPYDTLSEVKRLVSRSAYAQLRYSPLLLAATVASVAVTFILPPLLTIFGDGLPRVLGLVAWLAMALSFVPTLRSTAVAAVERCAAGNCIVLSVLHGQFRISISEGAGRPVEGTHSRRCDELAMIHSGQLRSGKGAGGENFPVASRLIKRRHRPAILAFYEFVRVADDIADHPELTSVEK